MLACPEAALARPDEPAPRAAWTTGFLTNVFNPKATLFFVAIFASLIDPATPKVIQGAYGLWMALTTMAWVTEWPSIAQKIPVYPPITPMSHTPGRVTITNGP